MRQDCDVRHGANSVGALIILAATEPARQKLVILGDMRSGVQQVAFSAATRPLEGTYDIR